ncbi:hypothetical protein HCN44_006233 [Aphidius gifuensis]|uniref:Ectopic P granules protein n=1 Tax=Aphidius gifuensis TaxID=684658 RepID=A0A834XV92_APHGI|nr:ectopic P granules protein 5 homolog [Aphidius gifuensis]KAF7993173.1 hypothetical protein HCN44_006233 [Aphidius gifuensis]
MEKSKSSKKSKKDRSRSFHRNKKQIVDDTTTLEEFECLLGESPANYVQIQSVDNMESELHSAAIDNELHEKVNTQVSITDENKKVSLQKEILKQDIEQKTIEESSCNDDMLESLPTAPPLPPENIEDTVTLPANLPSPRLIIEHNTNTNLVTPKKVEPTIIETSKSSNTTEILPFTDAQLISLYNNKELSLVESFITEFIETQLCRNSYLQQHRLYDLLTCYLRVRNKLQTNSHDLECIKKKCIEVRGYLWHLEKTSITESGECQDGNPVNATHEYSTAWLSQDALKLLTKFLSKIKELLHNIQALHSYEAETLKLQIEQYVQRVCLSCKDAMKLPQNAPVNLLSSMTMSQFTELRMCITILFSFQRRMINDNKFVMDSREWLSQLVAILLRLATWQDHQFILNHVLRCPGGVTKWAAGFIQAPNVPRSQTHTASPFSDPYLDHMVATLAVILLPVKEREKFLEQVRESVQNMTDNSTVDTVWVVLDEDGEEDEDISSTGGNLSEADIIMLVKQVPLGKIFEQVLLIEKQGENYRQETNNITEHHMLRLFAFSSILVRLFRQGLRTYNSPKYRQLAKLLSSMIRDVVQYVNDQWEVFLNIQTITVDSVLFPRLQTEFDEFFLRSTMSIISSRRLGALQYLAAIPYHTISINTLWRIFYALHHDNVFLEVVDINQFENESKTGNLWRQFDEKLSEMQEEESYFLISTFANMALARSECDIEFICATTVDLFRIGFLSKKPPESTSKNARSLLSNLTIKHPSLLSTILLTLKENFESFEKFDLQLFTELNIDKWIPDDNDIFIIANWLRNNTLQSTESHLARLLLKNLNWGLDNNKNLYLPLQLHYNIALLIVELTMKYVPDMPGSQTASLLIEGVRQVSSMVRPQNSEHVFSLWAWDMMCRLRLHQLDQSVTICQEVMTNPAGVFAHVPDIDTNTALEILVYGLKEKQPIACFVSVMMTLLGHSVPLICTTGFSKLNILQNYHKYKHILIALQHIIPLFLECPESLINNDKFIELVVSLITADRTYVKMAKNLIASEFPGPIVKYFANMIESHMANYEKYCLNSPEPFVRLWLEIIFKIPNWNRDQNVMYIIDCILRTAFFHIDSRTTADMLFLIQYSIMGNEKSSGSISSFINWATGNSNLSSLLGGSVHSIWLAFQVLSIEQHSRETNTGFWREFLRELSNQSKTSLDTAIKRACLTVKISPFSSGELSIYRWSQQILDTPFDHPLFPLLWQRFFILYLARVPTNPGIPDRGGIGEKFFDGLINGNHLKKLKKYLTETIKYFENIIESSNDNDDNDNKAINNNERRDFVIQTIKYYKTLNLWLNEERLLESGLYLPALPPQYMSHKLTALIQSDYDPWLEYVDYSQVLQSQLKSNQEWNKISYRCDNDYDDDNNSKSLSSSIVTAMTLESSDPLQRIYRRLSTYEYSQSPPSLTKNTTAIFDNISRNILHEADQVIQIVRPHFKAILEYAQTFNSLILEHTAVDCSFLELIKNLYQDVENTVTLHALCDSVSSSDHQRSRSGTPLTVHCAGAAIIKLSVKEARLTPGVDQMIIKNRGKYDNLVVKACQLPSSKVVQASVFIDRIIMLLENEINIHRTCEDTDALNKIHISGIKLFYYLVKNYTEEASLCPPTKQLVTACIEKLGQIFISGEENEGPRLLATIIERPNLGGMLGPHFTPVAGVASKFLEMYLTIVNLSTGSNVDLCFVLLSKFDVNNWLNHRRPRLSERSTFIDLVTKALCDIGLNPEDKKLILHELFRNHLKLVLLYEFPEHYGEVLSAILRGSEGQNLSLDVWQDFLGALSGKIKTETPIHPIKIREEIRRYATEQRLLSKQDIYDTAQLLSKHFMMERLQYGLYGLYPKYRVYNEPLVMFLGMVGHALVVSTLQIDRGSLANQICEQIWPVLSEMFAPWLTPYWTKNLREPTAAWIQQLTDDRSVLLPWITSDGPHANRIVAIFVECIRFIIDTLPASSKILCLLWQFYVTNYAHASVKDHIVNVIHGNLLTLTWDKFSPGINDVELMVKVIDQYLPDCHLFLGSIFTSVNWTIWINEVVATQPHSVAVRMHICLLNLFIKLSNEPNVRDNEKAIQLVIEATKFSWHLVDAVAYDQVINWYVMSCNPRVILSCNDDNDDDIHQLDIAINNMMKIVAAYDQSVSNFHPMTLKKRQLYVRSSMKLLMNCAIRHKSLLTTNTKVFKNTLTDMLNEMEIIIIKTVPELQQAAEAGLLLTELLESMNHQKGPLIEQLRESWINWLSVKTASSPILIGLLRVIGMTLSSSSIFGEILEASLESYFTKSITCEIETNWGAVMNILQPLVPRQPPIETVLIADNQLLALYAVLLKKLPLCRDIKDEEVLLVNLIDWISNVKPMENIQEKLPLLWAKAFELSYRQCQYNDSTVVVARSLKQLARALITLADNSGQGWGILGVIGLRKSSQLSIRFKFIARALSVYCLMQLPESKSEQPIVRFTPHSPGTIMSSSMSPDLINEVQPNPDAVKGIQNLETMITNKQYGEFKDDIELAIKMIKDSENSLHNAVSITGKLTMQLYTKQYLHILID